MLQSDRDPVSGLGRLCLRTRFRRRSIRVTKTQSYALLAGLILAPQFRTQPRARICLRRPGRRVGRQR